MDSGKYITLCIMLERPTMVNLLNSFTKIDNNKNKFDKAGFKAYKYNWQGINFLIFIIQEQHKNLMLQAMKMSNHAMVEGSPTLLNADKKPIRMNLIEVSKKLFGKNIVKEYTIEKYTGTTHERQALFMNQIVQ